jgi:uncharacterized protein involved in exopolysaccharide biosynthesis
MHDPKKEAKLASKFAKQEIIERVQRNRRERQNKIRSLEAELDPLQA